jgi:hypothetical protein
MVAAVIAPAVGGVVAGTKLQNAKSGWVASGGVAAVQSTTLSSVKVIEFVVIRQPKM